MGNYVNEISDSNFEEIISKGNVLIDWWGPWWGPCATLGPIMEELAKEMQGKVAVYKMNVDDNPEAASLMGIRGIPTVIMYKDGEQCFNFSGAFPARHWVGHINNNI